MDVTNFLFYQFERVKETKTIINFFIPEVDRELLIDYLNEEFIPLLSFLWEHPELKVSVVVQRDGSVTIVSGSRSN